MQRKNRNESHVFDTHEGNFRLPELAGLVYRPKHKTSVSVYEGSAKAGVVRSFFFFKSFGEASVQLDLVS